MKLKKILAAVLSAAMAVSMTAVTTFAIKITNANTENDGDDYEFNVGSSGVDLKDVYGFKAKINDDWDAVENTNGAIAFNCNTVAWEAHNWGISGGVEQEIQVASDDTITLLKTEPVFSSDDTWGKFTVQQYWGNPITIKQIWLLGENGTELYTEEIKAPEISDGEVVEVEVPVKIFAQSGAPDYAWSDGGEHNVTIKKDGETIDITWDNIGKDSIDNIGDEGVQIYFDAAGKQFIGQKIHVEITNITVDGSTLPDVIGDYAIESNYNDSAAQVMIPLGLTTADLGKSLSLTITISGELKASSSGSGDTPTDEPKDEPTEEVKPAKVKPTIKPSALPADVISSKVFKVKLINEGSKAKKVRVIAANDIMTIRLDKANDGKYANIYVGEDCVDSVLIKYGRAKTKALDTEKFTVTITDKPVIEEAAE